ncbi:GntR family transcriptional regulator [Pseudarthrobacter sp. AL07]|uniref:GntR family transcriptional regulator n=1 Tax=unclassified Pseudarthrobacter TaxID=2647000 RepID=UPI00249A4EE0|nr:MULTISPECIES: GntR family transcriptional regulator [unclassified Pseudarthrobacter]MDI3195608.1 GntR family transcriptional regulator [Pseudarthrobacter sp. AL20]MDI3209724.1 GntR family transcriptional regulator [Pseudarthrobacter sp. AL07]
MSENAAKEFKRPPTAQAFVLAELRRAIIAGDFLPGEPLRQNTLAERFGVSRVPVREAFKVLESEGQVVYEPHRGHKVASLSLTDLLEVYRLRQLLESEAARVAVENRSGTVLASMRASASDVEVASAAGDLLKMTEANRRFHFELLAAAKMPRLERIVRVLWDATEAYRFVYYGSEHNRSTVEREHAGIVQAYADGDVGLLVALMDEHREHAVDALRTFLDSPSRP